MCGKPQVFVTSIIFFELKTDVSIAFEADDAVASGLKEELNLLAAKLPPRCPPCCLLRAQRACTFDISADRNAWLQPALRSFAIVCDHMETSLDAEESTRQGNTANISRRKNHAKEEARRKGSNVFLCFIDL